MAIAMAMIVMTMSIMATKKWLLLLMTKESIDIQTFVKFVDVVVVVSISFVPKRPYHALPTMYKSNKSWFVVAASAVLPLSC